MFAQAVLPSFPVLRSMAGAFGLTLLLLSAAPAAVAQTVDTDALFADFARLYNAQKYAEALPIAERILTAFEKRDGKDTRAYVISLRNLADTHRRLDRYTSALPLYEEAKERALKVQGVSANDFAGILDGLGRTYSALDRRADAINTHRLQLQNLERVPPADIKRAELLSALLALAFASRAADQVADARRYWERALLLQEMEHGRESEEVARTLANIATTMRDDEDGYEMAKALEERALQIRIKVLGARHPMVGISLMNRANAERLHGDYAAAKHLSLKALDIMREHYGEDGHDVGAALHNLASIEEELGELDAALTHQQAAAAIFEKSAGEYRSSNLARVHQGIGSVLLRQGKPGAAIEPLQRSLPLHQVKGMTPFTFGVIMTRRGEALLRLDQIGGALSDLELAIERLREEARLTGNREHFGIAALNAHAELRSAVDLYLLALHRAQADGLRSPSTALSAAFEALQWGTKSPAAMSLTRMASRLATDDPELSKLIREYQDNANEYRRVGRRLSEFFASPALDHERDMAAGYLWTRHTILAEQLSLQRRLINIQLPRYAQTIDPKPLSVGEVQETLASGEALIAFHFAGDEGYVWSITKDAAQWQRLSMSTAAVVRHVRTLRCGLDASNWTDPSRWPDDTEAAARRKKEQAERRQHCRELTGKKLTDQDEPPFDLAKAHELYRTLFAGLEEQIKGKSLIVVASGPLMQLPLHVLVTAPPTTRSPMARAAWMAKSYAISLLPSIANLQALRGVAKVSDAAEPFIGFGNPLVVGPKGTDKRAFAVKSCMKRGAAAAPRRPRSAQGGSPQAYERLFRGRLGDVAKLRYQDPLPETADELCAIARAVGAPASAVHLSRDMSETALRKLNGDGVLARYRVVHFATHGLLAQESEDVSSTVAKPALALALSLKSSVAEPALLLTPPEKATEEDDGLLTASEIAQLKLNADWVVLSACNTAAGAGKSSTAPLSGLASAFFYSGARALLVSHWYVDSRAAVRLTSGAFAELGRDPSIGRAEAFRRAILAAMTDRDRPASEGSAAHPSVWGPFVLLGEGGANR